MMQFFYFVSQSEKFKSTNIENAFNQAFQQEKYYKDSWTGIMIILKELVLKDYALNESDLKNPFITFVVAKASLENHTLTSQSFSSLISPLKFLIRSFISISINLELNALSASSTSTLDPTRLDLKLKRNLTVQEVNAKLNSRLINYVQDNPQPNPTPYSSLVDFSGFIINLSRKMGCENNPSEIVSILDPSLLQVRIMNSTFSKMTVIDFFRSAIQAARNLLDELLLGYPLSDKSVESLLIKIGAETKNNTLVGHSFQDLFSDFSTNRQPVFGKWLKETKPKYFMDQAKKQLWLVKSEKLLHLLLVLIHTSCGAPPRATELLTIQLKNTPGALKNLTIRHGNLSR